MNPYLNFSKALEALKNGHKIARFGWNGKGMWLYLIEASDYELKKDIPFDSLAWIGMKTADNKFVPWLASQSDLLAEDWETVGNQGITVDELKTN